MDTGSIGRAQALWEDGYSIAELWGFTKPVTRRTSRADGPHPLLWGILAVAEWQVDKGAGHAYLRARLRAGDWTAIGYREPRTDLSRLEFVPPIDDAMFGRRKSALGDGTTTYVDVRIVHSSLVEAASDDRDRATIAR